MSAVLGEFVSEVTTLKKSGQLRSTTAARLERTARATAASAASLHPKATPASTTTAPASTTTAPASDSTPSQISSSDASPAPQDTIPANPALPADANKHKQKSCSSPWLGHHHPNGKGLGHGGFGNPKCEDAHYGWSSGGNNWQGGGGD